jgi:hypothetical protein
MPGCSAATTGTELNSESWLPGVKSVNRSSAKPVERKFAKAVFASATERNTPVTDFIVEAPSYETVFCAFNPASVLMLPRPRRCRQKHSIAGGDRCPLI